MKRVKIMLIAITVVAGVAGAFAFKAAKTPLAKIYTCGYCVRTCRVTFPTINPPATTIVGGLAISSAAITVTNIAGLPCENNVIDCTLQLL